MKRQTFPCALAVLLGILLSLVFIWLRTATPVRADSGIRYVATDGNDGWQCESVAHRCATVQRAIDVATPGDEIRVAGGTYAPGGTVASIAKGLTIIGAFGPSFSEPAPEWYETVLDAGWNGSVISITNAGEVTLQFLTLTHGEGTGNCGSDGCGGGIYATITSLYIGNCSIIDNVASGNGQMGLGGGIYADVSAHIVDIRESRIAGNTANTSSSSSCYSYGGGAFLRYGAVMLQKNEILDNVGSSAGTGGYGGGIYLEYVTEADVISNTIRGNIGTAHASSGSGGGICLSGLSAYLAGNRIEDNHAAPNWAGYGGGVYITGQTEAVLTRNTIIENTASPPSTGFFAPGGGIFIAGSKPITLTNNLIARNTASPGDGGGVFVSHSAPSDPVLLFNNTIADNKNSGVVVQEYVDLTLINNIIAGHAVGVDNTSSANSTVTADTNLFWNTSDPIVGSHAIQQDPLLTSDHHLKHDSPAVNAGMAIPWLVVDLDGDPRPQGPGYDIGAFEGVRWEVFLPLVMR